MTPRISVVMPVHNGRPSLAEAIDSILKQTHRDFEFIIVDDGSTDGSKQVVELFSQNDSRLRFLTQTNGGIVAALQHGLEWSRCELVARMDTDHVAAPERLAAQVQLLDEQPDVVAVGSYVERMDGDGANQTISQWPVTHEEIDAQLLNGREGLAHPTAMMRHDALDAVGGYCRQQHPPFQDNDLWLRLAEHGRLANIPRPLLRYRGRPTSVNIDRRQQQRESKRAAVHAAYRRRGISAPTEVDLENS